MRKFYAALLSLFTLFLTSTKSEAQVNIYSFVQSAGDYTAITGTTVHAAGYDDNVANVTIPFSFTFNGTAYTSVNVSSNGFITFGATAPGTTNYAPISSTTAYNGAIAAFGRDLISNGTTIDQTTLGATPNRQFVVQWNNASRYNGGTVTGDVLNFQIILNETSNVVQVVYGVCTATNATALTCQVGLRGATNTDFNNRSTTTDWNATTAGATNTASCTSSNTIMPVAGLTFTWLPASPCVPGSLIGGTTQGPSSFCSGGSFTLSVTGASIGTGLTYEWQTSSDGVAWGAASGTNTNPTYTASIATNTYFRRKMTCSGTDAFSASLLVTVSTVPIPLAETFSTYLTTFPPICWSRNNASFVFGAAASAFGSGTGSTRFDFYNSSSGTQLELVSPLFTAVPANYFLVFDHAYATFFNEVDQLEILYSTNGGTSYTNLITYAGGTGGPLNTGGAVGPSFTPTASQWATKIIALPTGTNKITFRGISAFGNNLYVDNIVLTACTPPTGLTAIAIAPTTTTLNWIASTSNPSGGYQWEVRTSGAAGSGATGLAASGTTAAGVTTANVTGLTPNTSYSFYVRSNCGGSDFSVWAAGTFLTLCSPLSTPLLETFSTYATTFPPTCWSANNALTVFGDPVLTGQVASANGIGLGSARYEFYWTDPGTFADLVSPLFTPVPVGYFLAFDHAYATFSGENDQLQILYSIDGGITYTNLITYNGGTNGPLNTAGGALQPPFSPTSGQWANKAIALPAGTNRLLFRGVSAFGNNLYLDNILIASCLPPNGLGLSALSPTSATLSWTASASNPSNGYQWEVRTSGAPGSGAAGLTASGVTAAGVTTANVTGLSTFTTYSYYVRSDCGGSDFSIWGSYAFTTPCNPISVPFTEDFVTFATTFPPTCWLGNNASFLTGQAASAYGVGLGSAKFDFYNAAAGTQLDLVSPLFAPSPAGWGLIFDHAYATFSGEVDSLRIMYSTNAGATYSFLASYAGGGGGPLNTAGAVGPAFTPAADQWVNKAVVLPAGTNRLLFKGISAFGNNLFLDNIAVVSCLPPGNVKAQGISPTQVVVTFNSPGTQFIIEYGAPGFTPGTGNTAGAGGTLAFTASSPYTVGLLNPSTTYDFYVRQICTPGVDYSINIKATATTLCPATNVPYLQNFETAVSPALPSCTSSQDVNGNSGSFNNGLGSGAGSWETYSSATLPTSVSPTRSLIYFYDFNDLTRGADDWFFIQGLNLTAGTTYRLKFFYKASFGPNFPEKLEVKYGTTASAADMTGGTLFTNSNIITNLNSPFDSARVDFTPSASGAYYIGFHAFSDPNEEAILIDDISVKVSPVIDVGITGITLPTLNCPTNNVFLQATIRNNNLTPANFATYPVTVTASITGAVTGTVSTVLNSGTLAPNASMTVYLSPGFNFSSGGVYNIKTYTSSPFDSEPQNDTAYSSVTVNPNPVTPVISPSPVQVCIGSTAQLTVPTPAATNASITLSSTIPIPILDATATGSTGTLTVGGIPSTATITSISVTLNVTHTWINDVAINLRAPNGSVLNLFNRKGAAFEQNLVNTIINSTSTTAIPATGAPFTGTYKPDAALGVGPTGSLSGAAGYPDLYPSPNGNWVIGVRDYVPFDDGSITSWSITINYSYIPALTWTPVADLFTNSTATTAYTAGTNAYSIYVKPSATGTVTYTATATGAGGCTSAATVVVTTNPIPVIAIGSIPDTVCISDQLIPLIASPAGGSWSGVGVSGNNFVPPATSVGNYTLTYTYTSAAGCPATATKRIFVKDCPERMILLRDNAVILYPNPNSGRFNIKINSVLYNNLGMRVYTNEGTLVRTQQFSGLAWGRVIPVDLSHLPGGLYMIRFYYEGGPRTAEKTFKVIIGTE